MSRLRRHPPHSRRPDALPDFLFFYTFVSGSYLQLPIMVGCGGPVDKVTKVNPPWSRPVPTDQRSWIIKILPKVLMPKYED